MCTTLTYILLTINLPNKQILKNQTLHIPQCHAVQIATTN